MIIYQCIKSTGLFNRFKTFKLIFIKKRNYLIDTIKKVQYIKLMKRFLNFKQAKFMFCPCKLKKKQSKRYLFGVLSRFGLLSLYVPYLT